MPLRSLPALRCVLVSSSALSVACSASDTGRGPSRAEASLFEGPTFYESEETTPVTRGGAPTGFVDGATAPPQSSVSIDDACVIDRAAAVLVKQPVDIIVLLDNSGSMDDEAAAVEANINSSFASVLAESEVDYRVLMISRHRSEAREESEEASTSVCVQAPLSGLQSCEDAPEPAFSERFFQYSTKIESDDSFDVALDTYAPPFEDDDREEKFDRAPQGWSAWLRSGAKKVFLELTDDNEDMSPRDFLSELSRLAPEHFGSDPERPSLVFHSIVGLAEKDAPTDAYLPDEPIEEDECTGNDGDVTSAGETYQELSRLTGGLRFPLCQFDAYDVVFRRIAEDVVLTRGIACDFEIPEAPRGSELDLNNVAIAYAPGTGAAPVQFGQAPALEDCQADAFYIAGGRLNLCPDACASIRSDPLAAVTVLFTCESQLILPR